jgi:hypothetical protein
MGLGLRDRCVRRPISDHSALIGSGALAPPIDTTGCVPQYYIGTIVKNKPHPGISYGSKARKCCISSRACLK